MEQRHLFLSLVTAGIVIAGIGVSAPLGAQSSSSLQLVDSGMVAGEIGTVDVVLVTNESDLIQGFNIDVCHDESVLDVLSIDLGPGLLLLNNGDGPDFIETYPDTAGGVVFGCIFSIFALPGIGLEPDTYSPLFTIVYQAANVVPAVTTLEFCDIAACVGCPIAPTVLVVLGQSIPPALVDGTVFFGSPFLRGDANDDGLIDLGDPISLLEYLFGGGDAPSCASAADVNDDDMINMADPIFELGYLFADMPAPAAPFPACGVEVTPGTLTCDEITTCP